MAFGKKTNRMAPRRHAWTVWNCKCGRSIKGNAFHIHKRKCPVWLAAKQSSGDSHT